MKESTFQTREEAVVTLACLKMQGRVTEGIGKMGAFIHENATKMNTLSLRFIHDLFSRPEFAPDVQHEWLALQGVIARELATRRAA